MSNWATATEHPEPLKAAIHHIRIAEAHLLLAEPGVADLPQARAQLKQIQDALRELVTLPGDMQP